MLQRFWRFALLPLLLYVVAYAALTFPMILDFNRLFFCDDIDGRQMVWDVWWVRHCLLDLHRLNIFYTPLFHCPAGSALWLHSLTPINGLMGLPLGLILSQVQAYNALVIWAFAGSGLTAFWLTWDQTRRYWPSLFAGYAFAFCEYRFAHAVGHLNHIATQFLPLYLLFLLRMTRTATMRDAAAAGVCLLGVLLTDQYHFFYAVLLTAILLPLNTRALGRRRLESSLERATAARGWRALAVFAGVGMILCGPIVYAMSRAAAEPIEGHNPDHFSADVLNVILPGAPWQFRNLTRPIWTATSQAAERSVSLSWAAVLAAVAARSRRRFRPIQWWIVAGVFTVLALGPTLRVWTVPLSDAMPYRLLTALVPALRVAGCPARMMIVPTLAVSVLAAGGLARLGSLAMLRRSPRRATVALIAVMVLVIQSQPHVQQTIDPAVPSWVTRLRDLPKSGAVVELRTSQATSEFYYQTIHRRPAAFGNLSRLTPAMAAADQRVRKALAGTDYRALSEMGFVYLVINRSAPVPQLPLAYEDNDARIYSLSGANGVD